MDPRPLLRGQSANPPFALAADLASAVLPIEPFDTYRASALAIDPLGAPPLSVELLGTAPLDPFLAPGVTALALEVLGTATLTLAAFLNASVFSVASTFPVNALGAPALLVTAAALTVLRKARPLLVALLRMRALVIALDLTGGRATARFMPHAHFAVAR